MNHKFLLFIPLIALISSCSNAFKVTQTPDDVYYSTAIGSLKDEDRNSNFYAADAREIKMSKHDNRWKDFDDDYNYSYDPYHYGYNYGYYYNPFYYPYPVYVGNQTITNPKNTTPRTTNLGSYSFHNLTTPNPKSSGPIQLPKLGRSYNNSNSSYNTRSYISPRSESSGENNTRNYTPSSNSSNSSGSSGTKITRPGRG
jgi:hypothetical protein